MTPKDRGRGQRSPKATRGRLTLGVSSPQLLSGFRTRNPSLEGPEALILPGNTWPQQPPAGTSTTVWMRTRHWVKPFIHIFPPDPYYSILQIS